MIQPQTILRVSDNSGAKTVRCIRVLGGFKKKYAKLGDFIIVSVQNLRNRSKNTSKVKKHDVYKALVVKTKVGFKRLSGMRLCYNDNSVVLMNKQGNPIGTRITSPLPRFFRTKKYKKFTNISPGLI
jgi:large subunit ribosomal protein L14